MPNRRQREPSGKMVSKKKCFSQQWVFIFIERSLDDGNTYGIDHTAEAYYGFNSSYIRSISQVSPIPNLQDLLLLLHSLGVQKIPLIEGVPRPESVFTPGPVYPPPWQSRVSAKNLCETRTDSLKTRIQCWELH